MQAPQPSAHVERSFKTFTKISFKTFKSFISLARTPEIGQGLGRILSCGARKPEQT